MNAMRHTLLGLFFFVTMGLLGYFTIYLGDVMSPEQRTTLVAWFDTVDGLGVGDPVMIRGVQSGRVTKVAIVRDATPFPERPLRVEFIVNQRLELRGGYTIAIGSPSLLGGKEIDVLEGDREPLAATEYSRLVGLADANLVRNLAGLLDENRADIHRIVHSVANLTGDLDAGKRSLAEIALSPASHAELASGLAGCANWWRSSAPATAASPGW